MRRAAYPYQTVENDASISAAADVDEALVVVEVAAGSCITIELPLHPDEAEGLLGALRTAIDAARA